MTNSRRVSRAALMAAMALAMVMMMYADQASADKRKMASDDAWTRTGIGRLSGRGALASARRAGGSARLQGGPSRFPLGDYLPIVLPLPVGMAVIDF